MPPECGELGEDFVDEDCGECARESCCEELDECDGKSEGTALMECRAQCFDPGWVTTCEGDHDSGVASLAALDSCLAGPCVDACPVSEGICDTSVTVQAGACDECLGDNCCMVLNDCLADAACEECMTTADGVDCDLNTLYTDATSCFETSCATICDQ